MTALAYHFIFEFSAGLRNRSQLLMSYLFPLAFFGMMGLVMTQINPLFKDTMIPSMIVFAALASAVLGLPGPMVQAREAGIYRSFKINGVSAFATLAIPALTTMFHIVIVTVVITGTGLFFFDGKAPANWGGFALLSLVTAFACAAIGSLIGVLAKSAQSTVLGSQLIFLPSMLLGGLMMPINILPETVRHVSAVLPATHAMQAFLGIAYNQETTMDPWLSTVILLVGGLLALGLAIYLFNWDSQSNSRRGHPMLALLAVVPFLLGIARG